MTQEAWILSALQQGPITAIDALNGCGCFRLAARIKDLRDAGHNINTTTLDLPSGKRVAQYSITNAQTK